MRPLAFVALLIILASFAGATASADDGVGTFPVRTTAAFEGGSFEAWRNALDQLLHESPSSFYRRESPRDAHFGEPIEDSEEVFEEGDADGHRVRVRALRNCDQLLSALASDFDYMPGWGLPHSFPWLERHGPTQREVIMNDYRVRDCRVARAIAEARPSSRSFLHDFSLDEKTPGVVPWFVSNFGLTLDSANTMILTDTTRRRLSWAAWRREAYCEMKRYGDWYSWVAHLDDVLTRRGYDPWSFDIAAWQAVAACDDPPALLVERRGPHEVSYVEPWVGQFPADGKTHDPFQSRTTLSILAFADFNGDGLEDVLIRNQYDREFTTSPPELIDSRGHAEYLFHYDGINVFTLRDYKEILVYIENIDIPIYVEK